MRRALLNVLAPLSLIACIVGGAEWARGARVLGELADPLIWWVLGGVTVVFVLPAVTILALRDHLDRRWLRRYRRLRRLRGFEVANPRSDP